MGVAASIAVEERSIQARMASPSRFGDKAFEWFTLAMALAVVVLIILIGWQLWIGSSVAIKKFGFHFLVTSTWDPVAEQFGALPFIYGTLVSSLIALLIAVPLSIATAAYLTELAPLWIRQPLASLIEMLAAIPSVILGLVGHFRHDPVAARLSVSNVETILRVDALLHRADLRNQHARRRNHYCDYDSADHHFRLAGDSAQCARLATRSGLRFGRDALGSHAHRGAELRKERAVRRSDSWLGRALGETMAVTMVIGNTPQIAASLFKPGYTAGERDCE